MDIVPNNMDIASKLVNEMGLSHENVQQLSEVSHMNQNGYNSNSSQYPQQSQHQMQNMQNMNPQMQNMQNMQMNPNMQYPQNMQNPQNPQNPQNLQGNQSQLLPIHNQPVELKTEDTNTVTDSIENFGIDKNNIFDKILNEMKLPAIVMIIFILFSLPQVIRFIESFIKISFIQRSVLNMLLLRTLLVGIIFYGSNLLLKL